jgi:hypothetical protein
MVKQPWLLNHTFLSQWCLTSNSVQNPPLPPLLRGGKSKAWWVLSPLTGEMSFGQRGSTVALSALFKQLFLMHCYHKTHVTPPHFIFRLY